MQVEIKLYCDDEKNGLFTCGDFASDGLQRASGG